MPFKIFALNSSHSFGMLVSNELGVPLSNHEEVDFEDGEHQCRPLENVRNQEIYVIQSLFADEKLSINDKLCRLLFFIGALKDASAASVSVVAPYLCYARKDQKSEPRGSVTTRYVANLFEAVGIDHIITIDVHDVPAYQNAFRCPGENLEAKKLFVDYLADHLEGGDIVVMSPDIGGVKRAELFQKALSKKLKKEVSLVFKEKYREAGKVTGDTVVGAVKGKTVVVIDDMISTGTTLSRAVAACKNAGATGVIAAATHGLFSGKAEELLADESLQQIIVTNTILPSPLEASALIKKTTVLNIAPLVAALIKRMHEGGSITELLQD